MNVTTIVKDLSKEAAKESYDELREKNIAVDQLVNNAGAGKMGRVVDADTETMKELLHLNAVSVTLLCRYFGRGMEERGRGRIRNVSSMRAFLPDPWFNVYGPTKAYERFLMETMYGELKGSGVTVTVLCPGPTKTGWAKNAGKKNAKFAKNPDEVAKEGFVATERGACLHPGWRLPRHPLPCGASARSLPGRSHRQVAEEPDRTGVKQFYREPPHSHAAAFIGKGKEQPDASASGCSLAMEVQNFTSYSASAMSCSLG